MPSSVSPNILACCRVSVREADIFRFWLIHYARISDILTTLILVEEGDNCGELEKLCRQYEVKFRLLSAERFSNGQSMVNLKALVRDTKADWVIHTDSDEFLVENPYHIVDQLKREAADYAEGLMIDRLAADGRLSGLDGVTTINELENTYPLRSTVTQSLTLGCSRKVCLSRWPYTGNIHEPEPGLKQTLSKKLTLEHFKWRKGLEDRLLKRITDHTANGKPWALECKRALAELEAHGRIRAELWPVPPRSLFTFPHHPIYRIRSGYASSCRAEDSWRNFPVEDVPAIVPDNPTDLRSCERSRSQAHSNALRRFLATSAAHCIVIEEDAILHYNGWLALSAYDCFLPFSTSHDETRGQDFNIRHGILPRYGAHAYIASRHYAQALIPRLEAGGVVDVVNAEAGYGLKVASYNSNAINHDNYAMSISEAGRQYHLLYMSNAASHGQSPATQAGLKAVHFGPRSVSFCTVCKERKHQLEKTMNENLDLLQGCNAELVLVDYKSDDGLAEWIAAGFMEYIRNGTLRFFRLQTDLPFSIPVGKNFAHRFASKEIIINLDADNYIGTLWFAAQNMGLHEFISCDEFGKGSFGRIGLWRQAFEDLGGYDESFEPAGYYDVDLVQRASASGWCKLAVQCSKQAVQHDKAETLAYCGGGGHADWRAMVGRNYSRSLNNLRKGRLQANSLGLTAAGFQHNFTENVELPKNRFYFL